MENKIDTIEWVRDLEYIPPDFKVSRLFCAKGKNYPLFEIGIIDLPLREGGRSSDAIFVSTGFQEEGKNWWQGGLNIPLNLISEFQEMLSETKEKFNDPSKNG
jgi:hypothetical protein